MAKVELHAMLLGLRGAIEGFVFSQYGNNIVLSRKPEFKNRTFSEKQRKRHEKFRDAAAYGREALNVPARKAAYAKAAKKGACRFRV